MDSVFFVEVQKTWDRFSEDGKLHPEVFDVEIHKKILDIFHIGKYYYYIFDLRNLEFQFLSPSIKEVLGYNSKEIDLKFFLSKIHEEDQAVFLNHEHTVTTFFKQLPTEKILKYKVSYDYRMINAEGKIVRILQQVVTLQYDDNNSVLLTLGVHTDITHLKKSNKSTLSFIGLEGEPSYINVEVNELYKPYNEYFTKREKEIAANLLKGYNSKKIAETLCISYRTVETHRKNILKKTGTNSIVELAVKIIEEGLFCLFWFNFMS
ncbi:MAG: hypothetical protein CFE24_01245 [Flavobacterium sp. BFFFF2]|nr:MAG: hypothetical protein CFE24_01245 [Flavobacterium sp. BFFFF2]